MKEKLIGRWGKPENSFWIIGTSSPWLQKYEVTSCRQMSPEAVQAEIKYYWATSAGPGEPTQETLTIIKQGGNWCVNNATGNENY
jgi:hypothetical protein